MIFTRPIIFATIIGSVVAFSINDSTISYTGLSKRDLKKCPYNDIVFVDGEDESFTSVLVAASQKYCQYLLGREGAPLYTGFVKRSGTAFRKQDINELVKDGQEVKLTREDGNVDWLILLHKGDKFKQLQDTDVWRRVNGTLVNAFRPDYDQVLACQKFMNDEVYDTVIKVFPELAVRAAFLTGRKGQFAMRDFDFDTIKFSDDIKFIGITNEWKVLKTWASEVGPIKTAEARFRDGWMRPRLERHSQFPIVDNPYHLGVCRS